MNIHELFVKMWTDYCTLNPAARRIYDLLKSEGEMVINDHIALRTLRHPRLGVEHLAQTFLNMGYQEKGQYEFKEKKLFAKHYEHPDSHQPKVFISELILEQMPASVSQILNELVAQVPDSEFQRADLSVSGRPWSLTFETFEKLAQVSEYAAWVASIGFRPNHFTVLINELKKYNDIKTLNLFLKSKGITLNASGGEVKGSPEELLEQSSTMASEVEIQFKDGLHKVPGCYYEFAKRYPQVNGKLYTGFIAKSADKIFESTNRQK